MSDVRRIPATADGGPGPRFPAPPGTRFPAVLADAENAAVAGQTAYLRLSAIGLVLACLAAAGGAIPYGVRLDGHPVDLGGLLAALAFAAGIGVASYLLSTTPMRSWYEGRAAAESVKTIAWQYSVGGGLFRVDTAADPDALLVDRLAGIMGEMRAVRVLAAVGGEQITPGMRALRAEPLPVRRAHYLAERVDDQVRWYGAKARFNQRRVRLWFAVAIGAQTAGLVAAGVKAFAGVDVDVLGIAAALAASGTAWLQTRDHQNLAESYAVTGRELSIIRARADAGAGAGGEEAWAAFVAGAERAVSREHTLWLARRGSA
ncbi:membrane protein [Pilimelia anulata]|uniref:Membrane protein n=1 Tax=Pilimelia anulata TaxID=53371 RepID=A0A8J3FB51_9ACTN|nr:DUF4231 domain-containing protein [Pilimelia anulata]GGJ80351.1 membrane protein [Pilimelia anulata]